MNAHIILWIYIALLLLGGVMGFVKAKSKASLIASSIFAVILALFNLNILPFNQYWIVLVFLMLFFSYRFAKTKKIMPNIMMVILTIITLALIHYLPAAA
ncbi:MAG: TMEM14 family protein [Verrucomicrobiales bacterium]